MKNGDMRKLIDYITKNKIDISGGWHLSDSEKSFIYVDKNKVKHDMKIKDILDK